MARVLPPGTYQDLVATEPLVLQKGAYVFVNLRMKVPGAGVGLDGRKATSLSLLGCRFEGGEMRGTGVLAAKDLTIRGCHFSGLENGIKVGIPKTKNKASRASVNRLTITGNTFTNNLTSVYIDNGLLKLELRCNVFSQTTPIPTGNTHVGLLIGENASLTNNRIGGTLLTEPQGEPNSNYFPRTINATTGAIEPFPNYFSVWNESASEISYYKYSNEDLGNFFPENVSNEIVPIPLVDITITRKNLELWCGEGTVPNFNWSLNGFSDLENCTNMTQPQLEGLQSGTTPVIPSTWKLACDGGPLDNIAFPIPRPAPADGETTTLIKALQEDGVYLGQSIPNPAQDKVTIPVFLPVLKGSATLEVFELSTGKSIVSRDIPGFGHHLVEMDTRLLASGMYGYRIVMSQGKSPAPRKMVILR